AGDPRCERQVQRWAPYFESPKATEPIATRLVVEIENAEGQPRVFDLSHLSAQGAVVRKTKGRYEVSLGAKPTSAVVEAVAPKAPTGFFIFQMPLLAEMPMELPFDPTRARFELLLPSIGLLTNAGAQANGSFRVT